MLTYIDRILLFNKMVDKFRDKMNPDDISLYHAFLRVWNKDRDSDIITISRDEILQYSLLSKNTFYKSIKKLEELNIIRYFPGKGMYGRAQIKFLNGCYV